MLQQILGIVGWIGTALVFGAVGVRFLRPEWDQYAVYAAWAGLACVILYTLGQWRDIVAYFRQRNTRYGALAGASVIIVLGILVAVNYVSTRQNKRWDLTSNKQYSLSEQTIKLLKELDSPVKFLVFDQAANFDTYRARLTEYEYQAPDRVEVEYVDADQRPVQARQYNVDTYGTVIIEYKGRQERVMSEAEQDLTNGLIKVITGQQKKVYFVQGHGEKDTANTERTGYSSIAEALGRDNYGIEKLVLAQNQDVPSDASVVVLAGPQNDLLAPEIEMFRRYLATGGHLLVLLDPPDAKRPPTPLIEGLLKEWSVDAGHNLVIDASGMGQLFGGGPEVPVATTYAPHAITERFNSVMTAFPLARSIAPTGSAIEGRVAQTIIETGPRSWAETDLNPSGAVAMSVESGDKPGPVSVGVAITAPILNAAQKANLPVPEAPDAGPRKESRMTVIGDSDFASNYALGIPGNRDLFVNTVNWLAQQEGLIAIRPREPDDRRITLTARSIQGIFLMSVFALPALVFGTGIYTWWRRR